MPVQSAMSELYSKFGGELDKAHQETKAAETKYSEFGDLPAPIKNGVAQLVECKLTKIKTDAKQNAGQWMFFAAGIVKSPEYFLDPDTGSKLMIKGLRTQISEVICPTPDKKRMTLKDHIDWIYNELRKLGLDTAKIPSFKEVEPFLGALKKAAPHFRFRTWKGDKATEGQYAGKEPLVNHMWDGRCDFDPHSAASNGATTGGTTDNTGANPTMVPPSSYSVPDANPDGAASPPDAGWADLGTAAMNGEDSAIDKLKTEATRLGYSETQIDGADSWLDVVGMIEAGQAPSAATTAAPTPPVVPPPPDEEWKPAKDDIYLYKVIDPKTGKPARDKNKREKKSIECQVKTVDEKGKTVDLLNMDDKKTLYKTVPWDSLESGE